MQGISFWKDQVSYYNWNEAVMKPPHTKAVAAEDRLDPC